MRGQRMGAALAAIVASAMLAGPATADEAKLRKQLEELEKRQKQMQQEMEEVRRELAEPKPAAGERVEEVERRQGILTDEVRKLREALVLPETAELKSRYGLGPAASKVYSLERGLSIGGYGEANYRNAVSDKGTTRDEFDFVRLVLYAGYKYNDWIVFNSEIEFEHALTGEETVSSGSGEVRVEFATLDLLFDPRVNARFGLLLVPMGFLNEIHEPPFFHGNQRPDVERNILPATWSANGFGLFGEIVEGLQYRTYGISGLSAKGFEAGGIREGRQNGNREIAEDFAWVGRADYSPLAGFLAGGSVYVGNSGQNLAFGGQKPDVFTLIYEGHAQARFHGVELRALGAVAEIDDADALSAALVGTEDEQTIAERSIGYYFEAAYDVMPLLLGETGQYLAPWVRYSRLNTQDSVPSGFVADEKLDRDIVEVGLSYKPIPQVVFKLDYRNFDSEGGDLTDEVRVGGGFVF